MGLFQKKNHCFILSIDSGGYGSILPCLMLEKMEEELRMQGSPLPLIECFDIIIGSGSGAITSAMLLITGQEKKEAREIRDFQEKFLNYLHDPIEHYFFKSVDNMEQTMFVKHRYIERLLRSCFDDKGMVGKMEGNLLVPVLNTKRHEIELIDSREKYALSFSDLLVLANKYFFLLEGATEHLESELSADPGHLVNASLAAKNPALLALEWAKKRYPPSTEFHILSLGTGIFSELRPVLDLKQHLLYEGLQSQMASVNLALALFSNLHYYRLDIEWKNKVRDSTTFSSKQIQEDFNELGYAMIYKSLAKLRSFVSKLLSMR